jgi:hypothetical protein
MNTWYKLDKEFMMPAFEAFLREYPDLVFLQANMTLIKHTSFILQTSSSINT